MKKLALAASMSLLMSTTASANDYFTVDDAHWATTKSTLNSKLSSWYASRTHPFVEEAEKLRGHAKTWTTNLPKDSIAFQRAAYTQALEAQGVQQEGVNLIGLLNLPRDQWDRAIQGQLGRLHKDKLYKSALEGSLREDREASNVWSNWIASMLAAESHPPSISVDTATGTVTYDPLESFLLVGLSNPEIYEALTDSGYVTLTEAGRILLNVSSPDSGFVDLQTSKEEEAEEGVSTPSPVSTPSLANLLTGKTSLTLGGARVLSGADQREALEDATYMTGRRHNFFVNVDDDTVVINTTHSANADVVIEDLSSPQFLAPIANNSLNEVIDGTGYTTRLDDSTWLGTIAAKLQLEGSLRFWSVGEPSPEQYRRLEEAGFVFHSSNDGFLSFQKRAREATVPPAAALVNSPALFVDEPHWTPEGYLKLNPGLANLLVRPQYQGWTEKQILRHHWVNWGQKSGLQYEVLNWTAAGYLGMNPGLANLFVRPQYQGWTEKQILRHHWVNWGKKKGLKFNASQ